MWSNITQSKTSFLVSLIFCLALFLPLVGMLGSNNDEFFESHELRKRTMLPDFFALTVEKFPSEFESFFNDNFGFRHHLISFYNRIKYKAFSESGASKVLVGKEGWLFYTGDELVDEYRGITRFSLQWLEQWRTILEVKQKWLASQGVVYLFVVAPNKHSIYPEQFPDRFRKIRKESLLDQLIAYLNEYSDVKILDLRSSLIEQKHKGLLYYPTGTHWTSFGAFLASQEIASHITPLFPKVSQLSLGDVRTIKTTHPDDGLAGMLGIKDLLKNNISTYTPKEPVAVRIPSERNDFTEESLLEGLPRVVMFRDSFSNDLTPFLSENALSIRYLWQRWTKDTPIKEILYKSKPDIIIEEVCERFLKNTSMLSVGAELQTVNDN